MIGSLAVATAKSPDSLLNEMAHEGSDIAEVRASGVDLADGSVPLGDAEVLISSVRQAVTASANAVVQPRSHFGHSIPKVAREHGRSVRMGQTRRGSYIIPIISRVPILDSLDGEDERLFDDAGYEPFPRQAMRRLASALTVLRDMTNQGRVPSGQEINESVGEGVSHELCSAVAATLETHSVTNLDIAFSWARRLPVRNQPSTITFEEASSTVVRDVAEHLRGRLIVGEQTLAGFVKALDRDEDDEVGKVTIRALVNDQPRLVHLHLDAGRYEVASRANNDRVPVLVTGRLVREPGKPCASRR